MNITSTKIIGNVHDRYEDLKYKELEWKSFYSGWIEGRGDMAYDIIKEKKDNLTNKTR